MRKNFGAKPCTYPQPVFIIGTYDEESCRLVGEIVNVSADERVLNENGKVDPAKLRPITYDSMNHTYLVLGEKVGNAFKDGLKLK